MTYRSFSLNQALTAFHPEWSVNIAPNDCAAGASRPHSRHRSGDKSGGGCGTQRLQYRHFRQRNGVSGIHIRQQAKGTNAVNTTRPQGNATAFPKVLGLVATAAHASINFRRLSNGSDRA